LTPAARTRISISPSPGCGTSRRSGFSTSGPPGSVMATAIIFSGIAALAMGHSPLLILVPPICHRPLSLCSLAVPEANRRSRAMALFDDEARKPVRIHEIGQDLALLSVNELNERIGQLRDEIARLEAELTAKGATRNAAEALFRRA
jgi:uncharacterized small protein (DUF1192 family)